jgi:hypothetical protein
LSGKCEVFGVFGYQGAVSGFKPINFEQFVREVLQGKAKEPYANGQLESIVSGEDP